MDNLTHSLFGATLARTPLSRAGRGTTIALIVASNAPDVDIVTTAGGAVKYLEWHRGMSHGPIGIVGLGVITAGLVWMGRRLYDQRTAKKDGGSHTQDASFGMLVAVSIVGVLLHVLMDLPTSYGTRLLSPFDWHWFAVDWMPIVDIYLLMALVIGLLGRSTPAQRRAKAAFVLLLMATNYGVRGAAHHQALEVAPRLFGPTLPPPCDPPPAVTPIIDRWPRASGALEPPAGQTVSRRNDRDAVVHLAVLVAHHRADVERVRDSRHRPARPEVPGAGERIGRTVADHDPVSKRVDSDRAEGIDDTSRSGVSRVLADASGAIRGGQPRRHDRPLDRHAICRRLARHG